MPTIDVVIVNWNSGDALSRCLASLEAASRSAFTFDRICIVDNASDQPWQPDRYPSLPALTMMRNADNVGFAVACNQGAVGSRADLLLFINPDTAIAPDALDLAVAAFQRPDAAGTAIVGLQLVNEQGEPQATCGRFLTPARMFNQVSGLSLVAPRWFQGFRMTDWDHRASGPVDYVSAACLIARRPVFEALGGFDARFTVYLEDVDLAWRARQAGWGTYFLAESFVYHQSGWGSGRDRGIRLAHAWRSLLVYGHRHWGRAGRLAGAAMALLLAPAARVAQGIVHRSPTECRDAGAACLRLAGLLRADVARHRGQQADLPPRAEHEPAPHGGDGAIDPAVHTSS